jgi:hypothetical protein
VLSFSYALELLRFREAGVEVLLKVEILFFGSSLEVGPSYCSLTLCIEHNMWSYFHNQSSKCFRTSERGGTGSLVHSTTYLDRLIEFKSLLKLSNDW